MNAICPINSHSFGTTKKKTRQGRPIALYPTDEELPWHTSWIDESIGGMSVPNERVNYPALINMGVTLIVNLTESPVTPNGNNPCSQCNYSTHQVEYESDMFDDVNEGDLEALFLPVQDGYIPTFEQVEIFLEESKRAIDMGGKVMVHCHAGVGRTGVFLAIWMMEKYKLEPEEAIKKLRHVRPQSIQFNPDDWFVDPFLLRKKDAYQRNLIQERYIHLYHTTKLLPKWSVDMISNSVSSSDTLYEDVCLSPSSDFSDIEPYSESHYVFSPEFTVTEVDDELQRLLSQMSTMTVQEGDGLCYVCKRVLAIGPAPILANQSWPPVDANIVYKK